MRVYTRIDIPLWELPHYLHAHITPEKKKKKTPNASRFHGTIGRYPEIPSRRHNRIGIVSKKDPRRTCISKISTEEASEKINAKCNATFASKKQPCELRGLKICEVSIDMGPFYVNQSVFDLRHWVGPYLSCTSFLRVRTVMWIPDSKAFCNTPLGVCTTSEHAHIDFGLRTCLSSCFISVLAPIEKRSILLFIQILLQQNNYRSGGNAETSDQNTEKQVRTARRSGVIGNKSKEAKWFGYSEKESSLRIFFHLPQSQTSFYVIGG